jgi:hypothetical protein
MKISGPSSQPSSLSSLRSEVFIRYMTVFLSGSVVWDHQSTSPRRQRVKQRVG